MDVRRVCDRAPHAAGVALDVEEVWCHVWAGAVKDHVVARRPPRAAYDPVEIPA